MASTSRSLDAPGSVSGPGVRTGRGSVASRSGFRPNTKLRNGSNEYEVTSNAEQPVDRSISMIGSHSFDGPARSERARAGRVHAGGQDEAERASVRRNSAPLVCPRRTARRLGSLLVRRGIPESCRERAEQLARDLEAGSGEPIAQNGIGRIGIEGGPRCNAEGRGARKRGMTSGSVLLEPGVWRPLLQPRALNGQPG